MTCREQELDGRKSVLVLMYKLRILRRTSSLSQVLSVNMCRKCHIPLCYPVRELDSVMEYSKFHYAICRPGFRPVADRFELCRHDEIALTWSQTRSGHTPLRYPAREPRAGRRPSR